MSRSIRSIVVVAIVVLVAGISYSVFYFQREMAAMDRKVSVLTKQVTDTMQMARQEAVVASTASQRATEAAGRAEIAAGARASAEQQREQAQVAQSQAESAARKAAQQADEARTQLQAVRQEREKELDQMQEALNHVVETKRTANGMVMVLPDSSFKFDFDSADLKPRNRELLSRIAGILLASKGFSLSIFGYTDDIGSKDYNQKLSERRAEAVRKYLVDAGIDASLVNAKGYGKTSPRVEGESEQARATNRRVEIAVTNSEIIYSGAPTQ